ncbi:MAG: glycogen synthase GlgA [Desulfuromonadales bacterium]|nr:glycogen synthase GlgA [Desulfuromonadales bacterium]
MKILFVASEVAPFAKTGGLADVAGALPKALRKLGHDVRVVMPAYRGILSRFSFVRTGGSVQVPVGGFFEHADIWQGAMAGVPVYLLDHPEYFDRHGLYGAAVGDFADNAERFAFFCRGALELCKELDFVPDVIHGNDWQCGLLPVFLRSTYQTDPFFVATGTLFTIHNLGYQGHFAPTLLKLFGLSAELNRIDALEFYGAISLLKGGVVFSDVVTTVSDTYCREIQSPEYGHGFDGILRAQHNRLFGVLNGLDPDDWDPQQLPDHPFSSQDLAGKAACKRALQQELGLKVDAEIPLIVMVSRLDRQKGFELIEDAWDAMMELPVQFALLGSGNRELEERFSARARSHAGRFALTTGFNEDLSRRFYAGGDLFLMPSLYEPCGLSQLIALRYGTLPVVRSTGGLADTILDPQQDPILANGFSFVPYTATALLYCLNRALQHFAAKGAWQKMMRYAMTQEFTWQVAAHRYLELYRLAQEIHHEGRR